ncbi:hypothetical protein Poly21_08880 [Allorhodopirellula heiligendammensis]|uniref:Uncharacterized protein n=1 Tax=Allorhodopirellula heiligendammensis TaxID=2714739 RepID=A0A5C6C3Q7_9BACT|nr:hypothetical protein Poly21_08880 [Allorhodopirellula heiligendammensis]
MSAVAKRCQPTAPFQEFAQLDTASQRPPRSSAARPFCIGFLLGAIVIGAAWTVVRVRDPKVLRNVTVSYMYETSPGSASGNNSLEIKSIEFYAGYLMMTDNNDMTRLLAIDRLRSFSFKPSVK